MTASSTHRFPNLARIALICVGALLLRADSCTEERTVQTPVNFHLTFDIDVRANVDTDLTVTATADIAAPMRAAIESRLDDDLPTEVRWAGMGAAFVRNDGFDTERRLTLEISDGNETTLLAQSLPNASIPSNAVGETAIVGTGNESYQIPVFQLSVAQTTNSTLESMANARLAEYVATGDIAARDLTITADWDNDRDPNDPADDFTLRVQLNFQMLDERTVDVYSP